MFSGRAFSRRKNDYDAKEKLIEEIQSRIMGAIGDLISDKIREIIMTGSIDEFICEKIKTLLTSASFSGLISADIGEEKKGKEVNNTKITSTSKEEEKQDPISYNEALAELGGEEIIAQYKGCSDDLQLLLADSLLMKEINQCLPPSVDRLATSIQHINQSYVNNIDDLLENGSKVFVKFKHKVEKFAIDTNAESDIPRIKSRERAVAKAEYKYRGNTGTVAYYRLIDIVRGTLVYSSIPDLYNGLAIAMKHFKVREFNDRYQIPLDGGYRDIQLVIEVDTFMCELQLTTNLMLRAKKTCGHRNYEVSRRMVAAVRDRNFGQVQDALNFGKEHLGSSMKSSLFGDQNCRLLAHEATKVGDVDILGLLLQSGAGINTQDEDGNTPLHYAIYNGHESCAWLLINRYKCNLNVRNKDGETPLVKGYMMLHAGKLAESATRAMITLMQELDKKEIEETIELKDAFIKNRRQNNRSLVDHAADGDVEKMKNLLQSFADPNSSNQNGKTALQMAVCNGHLDALKLLLEYGVSLDTREGEKNIVQEALDNKHIEIAKDLRNFGACCQGTSWESLVEFSAAGDLRKMADLLKAGVDPNSSKDGMRALEASIRGGNSNAFKLLLQNDASLDDVEDKIPMVEVAHTLGHENMVHELFSAGATCRNVAPMQYMVPFSIESASTFNGIARYKNKLFCCPHNSRFVLVIDGNSNKIHSIPLERSSYIGIALCGTKLYCAPCDASSVLIIDGDTEEIHTIPCPVNGSRKWAGIATYKRKLFCSPYNASSVLVIDTETDKLRTISCDVEGICKWEGIALCGSKMYCAPAHASSVLVIDCESEKPYTISLDSIDDDDWKWAGIACYGNKLYCAPSNASSVLVINADTDKIELIPCGIDAKAKWHAISRFDTKLVCAPMYASTVLIIDGETGKVTTRSCIDTSCRAKWSGIVQYGTKLFCSPYHTENILVFQDEALQLTLSAMTSCNSNETEKQLVKSSFLVDYTKHGNTEKMEELLEQGVDPNSVRDGVTALQVAVRENHINAVGLLMSFDVSTNELPIVEEAMNLGFIDIVKKLSEGGASYAPLVTYARDGNVHEMRKILSFPINPSSTQNGVTALQKAVREGHREAVELLLRHNASTADSNDGVPILQDALDFDRDIEIARMLVDAGATCDNIELVSRLIPIQDESEGRKWVGNAEYNGKVFFAPYNSVSVLVIDVATEEIRTISTGIGGNSKWSGITRCGSMLYCAPRNASMVLVIDGDTEEIRFLPCDVHTGRSDGKWKGIAAYGTKLFCCPYNASSILVIDSTTEELRYIPCNTEGDKKWEGVALYRNKLFCSPYNASSVLVINAESETIRMIPCGIEGSDKWSSIARCNHKLYCVPQNASSVLVINGNTEETDTIPCGVDGKWKWNGAAQFGNTLVCPPENADSVLVVHADGGGVSTRPCGDYTCESKWIGVVRAGGGEGTKLFCCPHNSNNILVLEDARTKILELDWNVANF